MGNINDHRIDITGQDWSGAFRADGDYIAWRHVEPIVEANKTMLKALTHIRDLWNHDTNSSEMADALWCIIDTAETAIYEAEGTKP